MIRRVLAFVMVAAGLFAAAPARADEQSAWDRDLRSAVRLIAAAAKDGVQRAAVEIRLDPGWKTYWRYPGDSGVPTELDFSASDNVKSILVQWPAPVRFPDGGGGASIGYSGGVVLPVHVVPADPRQPVVLRLRAHFGVCEKLCVPAQAKAELPLTPGAGQHEAKVRVAEARVPRLQHIGAAAPLAVRAVTRTSDGDKPAVDVEVVGREGVETDLFAEGPTAQWALPLPRLVGASGEVRRFRFQLEGLPPGQQPAGALLRLTAVAGDNAIETTYRLD